MDMKQTGAFLAQLRREQGLTQEQLGEKLGVTNKTISRWENGNNMPDIEMLGLISREFDVTINELVSGERLDEVSFRKEADSNLVTALENSAFTLRERIEFFKKRWLRAHLALIIFCLVACLAGYFFTLLTEPGVSPIIVIVGFFVYGKLRNDMMIYVEAHAFLNQLHQKTPSPIDKIKKDVL